MVVKYNIIISIDLVLVSNYYKDATAIINKYKDYFSKVSYYT
jgi:hypothetical protein